ncbi:MAG: peptide chain release factor N(5)-glutamine methyltransferase [Treponema sp.]|jgi:release factor glutamine methyltransferase|nr:peptide chain release factor N(5)-glutamine methyltransferase [Treponema sp.]
MTIREALASGIADLKEAGIENSALDASLLLARVLSTSRTALTMSGSDPLPQEALSSFRSLIDRRLNGECVAYILEKKEWRGLEFLVNPSVLVPRPDTETMIDAALDILQSKKDARVLDLCTGSGNIAIALKHEMPLLDVFAADISADALETAKTNAARLLPGSPISFFLGDLYDALPSPFFLITCNPPYIPSDEIKTLSAEVQKEPLCALDGGPSGLTTIKRVIEGAPDFLCQGGSLLLEADSRQIKDILPLFEKNGFSKIKIYNDLSGLERVIGGVHE